MAGNSCRNPDKEHRVWCYTSDDGEEWEYCDVPICNGLKTKNLNFLKFCSSSCDELEMSRSFP